MNEVYLKVVSEPSVVQELSEHLTFMVPGAKFMPSYKNKFWDGKIRLLNSLTGLTYTGLVKEISEFAASRNYDIALDPELQYETDFHNYQAFIDAFKLTKTPRDYQAESFKTAIENDRGIFLSPTASGKSLIIYLLACYYQKVMKQRILVIVPSISLVLQMRKDFEAYQGKSLDIHCITAGVDKMSESPITVTTWHSIYKMPKPWFKQFGCVIGDEVHQFKAASLKSIMEKLEDCRYRFGFTGTLDGSLTNKVTLEGLFGPVKQVVTTTELMEQKHVANLKIKAIILQYPSDIRQQVRKYSFQDEIDFIVRHEKRNKFIRNLALSTESNTLVLFQYVEKHGQVLYDMMKSKAPDRKIFFVHGGVDGNDREAIREIVEKESNAIIVASYGTFSTGINILNLHNVVLASPSKSRVRILQSIGRGLRMANDKHQMTLYDVADDMMWKDKTNYTLHHFMERVDIYNEQGFDYRIINMSL